MKFVPPDTCIEDYRVRRAAFMKHVLATWPNDAKRARHIIDWLDENSPYEAHEKMQNLHRGLYGDERH